MDDRNDLWQVLLMLTERKVADLVEKETTQKKGGGAVVALSSLATADGEPGVDRADDEPTPAEAMADGFGELLAALPDDELRRIAVWKLEGYTNAEIADPARANVALATVERKLKRIRDALTPPASHRRERQRTGRGAGASSGHWCGFGFSSIAASKCSWALSKSRASVAS